MKILVTGYHNPHFKAVPEYVEMAIRQLGHECIFIDDRRYIIPGRIRQRSPLLERLEIKRINHVICSSARRIKPTLWIVIGGHRILPETVIMLKGLGVTTVLWTTDPPKDFKTVGTGDHQWLRDAPKDFMYIMESAAQYDHVFCAGSEAIEILHAAGVAHSHLLPFACVPEIHRPVSLSAEEQKRLGVDIAFVGSHYPNRESVLCTLAGTSLGIWGPGWKERVSHESPLAVHIKGGQVQPEEWRKIYSASRTAVVIHFQNGPSPCYQVSPKVFEALACKKLVFVDKQPDALVLFADERHVVFFDDADDLRRKVTYYLARPDQMHEIAEAGYHEVLQRHTYAQRIATIIKMVKPRE